MISLIVAPQPGDLPPSSAELSRGSLSLAASAPASLVDPPDDALQPAESTASSKAGDREALRMLISLSPCVIPSARHQRALSAYFGTPAMSREDLAKPLPR
jgi:hypothetical protein